MNPGDGDITQLASVGDAREQYLMLVAATEDFFNAPDNARCAVVLFHLQEQRIAHYRAVEQPEELTG